MRNRATRVAEWAGVGFLFAISWGFYFANAGKSAPIHSTMYVLARLTQPAAGLALYLNPTSSLSLSWVVLANTATYAALGLIVVLIQKRRRALRIPN